MAVVAGLGLIAAATIPAYLSQRDDPTNKGLESFGVSAAAAQCGKITSDEASGTGQHLVHFARALPALAWQPTEPDEHLLAAATRRVRAARLANLREPLRLDVLASAWSVQHADAVICINMIHVAPWAATGALVSGASAVLPEGGVLFLYGPYRRFGRHTAPSNEAFDAALRASDPEWGLRDLEAVVEVAGAAELDLAEVVAMPANNFSVVFRKRGASVR